MSGPETARAVRASVALVLVCLAACGPGGSQSPGKSEFDVMGTVARVEVHAAAGGGGQGASELVRATFDSVERRLSAWRDDSEVGRFNCAAAGTVFTVSPWLAACLDLSQELNETSDGAFDPGAGPLMRLWGFTSSRGHLPTPAELDSVRTLLGGYAYHPDTRTLAKLRDGARLDLGGIGKGFAVDLAAANLTAAGFATALVDLGGNIRVTGTPPGRKAWRVGIRDPRDRSRILATIPLIDRSVATSGSYEKFVEIEGTRYGHIMNPATGRPAEGLLSVTVICPSALLADGLSTTLYVVGPKRAAELLSTEYPEVDAVLVLPGEADGTIRILATAGLRGALEMAAGSEGCRSPEFLPRWEPPTED